MSAHKSAPRTAPLKASGGEGENSARGVRVPIMCGLLLIGQAFLGVSPVSAEPLPTPTDTASAPATTPTPVPTVTETVTAQPTATPTVTITTAPNPDVAQLVTLDADQFKAVLVFLGGLIALGILGASAQLWGSWGRS